MVSALALGMGACASDLDASYGGGSDYDQEPGNGDGAMMPGLPPDAPSPDDEDEAPKDEPAPAECNATDPVTLYLSPDDSNSMSSPVQAREAVLDGVTSLHEVPIRPWEFMNYYSFDYPAAEVGGVRVTPSLMASSEGEGAYTMQIAVSSEALTPSERAPMNITLVLDTSGSMGGHPMDMLKASCRAIAGSLREGDVISMVTWDTQNQVVLGAHDVIGSDDPTLAAAIESLKAGGGTDLHGGLTAGYEQALTAYDVGRINRIVLVSDGGANAGITDIETIAEHAGGRDSDGIYMVGVGVGTSGSYHDGLMDSVTDAGKGASVFINDPKEAERVFGEHFISTLDVAVRDVQVQLDMPPGFEVVRFSGEEISADPEQVEPQHLAPNDTMVFHQDIETCAPELVNDDTVFTISVRYLDGTTFEPDEVRTAVRYADLMEGHDRLLLKGAAVFTYAQTLQEYKTSATPSTQAAFEILAKAEQANPEDPDLAEIRRVLEAL